MSPYPRGTWKKATKLCALSPTSTWKASYQAHVQSSASSTAQRGTSAKHPNNPFSHRWSFSIVFQGFLCQDNEHSWNLNSVEFDSERILRAEMSHSFLSLKCFTEVLADDFVCPAKQVKGLQEGRGAVLKHVTVTCSAEQLLLSPVICSLGCPAATVNELTLNSKIRWMVNHEGLSSKSIMKHQAPSWQQKKEFD